MFGTYLHTSHNIVNNKMVEERLHIKPTQTYTDTGTIFLCSSVRQWK